MLYHHIKLVFCFFASLSLGAYSLESLLNASESKLCGLSGHELRLTSTSSTDDWITEPTPPAFRPNLACNRSSTLDLVRDFGLILPPAPEPTLLPREFHFRHLLPRPPPASFSIS